MTKKYAYTLKTGKAVAVTTGSFIICWPLAVTGVIGAYSQYKLPKNVKGIVERYIAA